MQGQEWLVEAFGCDSLALANLDKVKDLFARMVADLSLNPVAEAAWHQFPNTGGVTGLLLLAESHLAVHTFPEYGSLCLNLFCCRPRRGWDFEGCLRREFGACSVEVRTLERPYTAAMAGVNRS